MWQLMEVYAQQDGGDSDRHVYQFTDWLGNTICHHTTPENLKVENGDVIDAIILKSDGEDGGPLYWGGDGEEDG